MTEPDTRFRILAVDGGGMRGLVPALVLRDLERRIEALTGKRHPLTDYFHLLAGTSSGGLAAVALAARDPADPSHPIMDADGLVDVFREGGPTIFPPRFRRARMLRGFVRPKFSNRGLRRVVEGRVGRAPLSTALRDVVITTYDMTDHRPRYFKRHDAGRGGRPDPTMAEAAMATASAPTYLPPVEVEGKALVDGGVFAANPTVAAITEALKRESDKPARLAPDELFVVSLGTGFYGAGYSQRRLRRWGALAWIRPRGAIPALLRTMLDGQTASADHWARTIVERGRYFRIEAQLPSDIELDDARAKTLKELTAVADALIEERDPDLQTIAEELVAAKPIAPSERSA